MAQPSAVPLAVWSSADAFVHPFTVAASAVSCPAERDNQCYLHNPIRWSRVPGKGLRKFRGGILSRNQPLCLASSIARREKALCKVCEELLDRCGPCLDRYQRDEPDLFNKAVSEASSIEAMASSGSPSRSKFLSAVCGTWNLMLTDSVAVIKNKGSVTGLPLPGFRCVGVDVVLNKDGTASTVDRMQFGGGALNVKNILSGRWTLGGADGRTLEVSYEEAKLLNGLKFHARSKAVLRTTYVGSVLRIARSSRDLFVFKRV